MDDLVKLIKALESAEEVDGTHEFLSMDIPLVAEISRRAEELLITESGKCDWNQIEMLASEGYPVFPVERDGFGWLIGGISTQKGIITYG